MPTFHVLIITSVANNVATLVNVPLMDIVSYSDVYHVDEHSKQWGCLR
jgi:hypothetical protein